MKFLNIKYLILIFFCIYGITEAGTVLSSYGLGYYQRFPNVRSLGMGGTHIAMSNPYYVSRNNPASLYRLATVRLSLQYIHEYNNYKDNAAGNDSEQSGFDGFNFAVPMGRKLGFAIGLNPLTRMDYETSFPGSINNESYTNTAAGFGGVNTFSFSAWWQPVRGFAVGFSGKYIFGRIDETWKIEYENADFLTTENRFSTSPNGLGMTIGMMISPINTLEIGAVYSPAIKLDQETKFVMNEINQILEKRPLLNETYIGSIHLPGSWGVGAAIHPSRLMTLGVDYEFSNWSEFMINDNKNNKFQSVSSWNFGLELMGSRSFDAGYFERVSYRLGFSTRPFIATDTDGNSLQEKWLTFGFGFPLALNLSRRVMNISTIDIAFGFGRRGNLEINNLSENLFRFGISITGGEEWFLRLY